MKHFVTHNRLPASKSLLRDATATLPSLKLQPETAALASGAMSKREVRRRILSDNS